MSTRPWNRRNFLRRAGGSAVAGTLLPFVPILHREVEGQALPPRLFVFITPNGTVLDEWRPEGTDTSFRFRSILEPLSEFQDRMVIVDGCDLKPGGGGRPYNPNIAHAQANHLLTGRDGSHDGYSNDGGGGVSVDQIIAERIPNRCSFLIAPPRLHQERTLTPLPAWTPRCRGRSTRASSFVRSSRRVLPTSQVRRLHPERPNDVACWTS